MTCAHGWVGASCERTRWRAPGRLLGLVVPGLARCRVPERRSPRDAGSRPTPSCSTPSSSTTPSTGCRRRRPSSGGPSRRRRASCYAVKVGQFGSHRMKLRDAGVVARRTTSTGSSGSGPTSGPNLVQLPPRWRRNVERLDEFLDRRARRTSAGRSRCATRRGSTTTSSRCSRRHGAALCVHDLLPDHPWDLTDRLDLRPLPRAGCARRAVPRALQRPAAVAAGRPARRVARRRAATSTPTSTTTSRATRSSTPAGSATVSLAGHTPPRRGQHLIDSSPWVVEAALSSRTAPLVGAVTPRQLVGPGTSPTPRSN